MKNEKEIVIKNISRTNRSLEILWITDGKETKSCFYRHSDGTWGMDPDLAGQPTTIQSLLWILANAAEIPKKANIRRIVMSWN